MLFEFSHFQVWIRMEKRKRMCRKIFVFPMYYPYSVVYNIKFWISKNKLIIQAECFSWHLKQAGSATKMFTTVWESVVQRELDVVGWEARSVACDWTQSCLSACTSLPAKQLCPKCLITVPNLDIHNQISLKGNAASQITKYRTFMSYAVM